MSYGWPFNSSIWQNNSIPMSYGGVNKSSIWYIYIYIYICPMPIYNVAKPYGWLKSRLYASAAIYYIIWYDVICYDMIWYEMWYMIYDISYMICSNMMSSKVIRMTLSATSYPHIAAISYGRHTDSSVITQWCGNALHITGPSPVTGGYPSQRASNVDLWCFRRCQPAQAQLNLVMRSPIWPRGGSAVFSPQFALIMASWPYETTSLYFGINSSSPGQMATI